MPILFILIPIIILFYYSFSFFLIFNEYENHNFIALNFLIYAILPLILFTKNIKLERINNNFSFSKLKQNTAGVFFLIVTITTIILIGVPLLSDSINASKTNVSNHPLLVRFFRIGLPFYIIYSSIYYSLNNSYGIATRNKISVIALIIAPFFGFKGYIFFILWPIFFDLSLRKRKHFFKYSIYFLIVLLALLITTVSYIESKNLAESFEYILLRLTKENLLGNTLALDYQQETQGIYPIFSELIASFTRIIGSREVNLLQSKLYELYMGDNPYNMQVSVSSVIEYYVAFGLWGFVLHFVIITSVMLIIKKMIYSVEPHKIAIGIMLLNTLYESILNGLFVFKFFDLMFSLLIIYMTTKLIFKLIIKEKPL